MQLIEGQMFVCFLNKKKTVFTVIFDQFNASKYKIFKF